MKDIIIALDFKDLEQTKAFIERFDETLFVKVGMELYYAEGPEIITYLKAKGHRIFLDLKLHDIPSTVKNAMKNLALLGVDMVNVHASGGQHMMQAAMEGLNEGTSKNQVRPLCIAVTQLTSTSEDMMQQELLIEKRLQDVVSQYARLAKQAGLDGVVCSALESPLVHDSLGKTFKTITPGIRQVSDALDDQKRVVTPQKAKLLGSDFIVVGRSITKAANPVKTYHTIKQDFLG